MSSWNEADDRCQGEGVDDENPIEKLDDLLPDRLRLGFRLLLAGALPLAGDYFWPRISPASFKSASAIFLKYFSWVGYVMERHYSGAPLSFSEFLFLVGLLCEVFGLFIFVRRLVWRAEDRRDQEIPKLDLK